MRAALQDIIWEDEPQFSCQAEGRPRPGLTSRPCPRVFKHVYIPEQIPRSPSTEVGGVDPYLDFYLVSNIKN